MHSTPNIGSMGDTTATAWTTACNSPGAAVPAASHWLRSRIRNSRVAISVLFKFREKASAPRPKLYNGTSSAVWPVVVQP